MRPRPWTLFLLCISLMLCVFLLLFKAALLVAQAPAPAEPPLQEQLDRSRVLLEIATQDHNRCKNDLADVALQARKLSLDYQQVMKERDALKAALPKDAPATPTN